MMRKALLWVVGVLWIFSVQALDFDEAVQMVVSHGQFIQHSEGSLFMANALWGDTPLSESEAYEFVAQASFIFLMVQQGWYPLSDTELAGKIRNVDKVCAPWDEPEQQYVLLMSMSTLKSEFNQEEFNRIGEDEMYSQLSARVRYSGQISILSMFLDE
jgi:hypothetical protein